MKGEKKKVYVGMSGGVDSSVSALLLKNAGYDVVGVFIKTWQPDVAITGSCTWREDRLDAMRACAKIGIPFQMLDLEAEYKENVADYMIAEYRAGRTPNPDVMCNKYVKFGAFFEYAIANGANYVATGHYVRVTSSGEMLSCVHGFGPQPGPTLKSRPRSSASESRHRARSDCEVTQESISSSPKIFKLLVGKDNNKDQSYFLWTLTQKQLSRTLFPIGDMEKGEVRKIAKKHGLSVAEKKDSQGVCFLGKIDMKEFLMKNIKEVSGDVLNENGEVVGRHDGSFYFTIGERHGFEIFIKTPDDGAYYVIAKDLDKNTITVSQDKKLTMPTESKIVKLRDISWTDSLPDLSKKYQARIRYRQPVEDCKIVKIGVNFELHFDRPQRSVSSGQSAVIYDLEVCLGGGIIL